MNRGYRDDRPGFRRQIIIQPRDYVVVALLEDDIHCLGVTLRHDGLRVAAIHSQFERAPWSTCPGATGKLVETFSGKLLLDVTARIDKKQNCTHLHDMAVLAAAHALDHNDTVYDMIATDPVDGLRYLELRRNGELLHAWTEQHGQLTAPHEIAGRTLFTLRDWISTLEGAAQEAARILQWASIVAHGRTMPMERQRDATAMPPNCYTFQPERAVHARQSEDRRDFSDGSRELLTAMREKLARGD
jgi:hypothetical protein